MICIDKIKVVKHLTKMFDIATKGTCDKQAISDSITEYLESIDCGEFIYNSTLIVCNTREAQVIRNEVSRHLDKFKSEYVKDFKPYNPYAKN